MTMTYNEFSREVVIEWHEQKDKKASPIYHSLNRAPTMVQLHPKDPTKIVRAHFEGARPGWISDYIKKHNFKSNVTQLNDKLGWWIANWKVYEKDEVPFSAPSLKGIVRQLSHHIPDVYPEGRERILGNMDSIIKNLLNYPTAFIPYGVWYRPEERKGEYGCLLLDNIIPLRESSESDEDYRSRILRDGRLDELIFELSTPLPDPEPQEEECEILQSPEESMSGEFLPEELEELPITEFKLNDLSMEEFTFDEHNPGAQEQGESVFITDESKTTISKNGAGIGKENELVIKNEVNEYEAIKGTVSDETPQGKNAFKEPEAQSQSATSPTPTSSTTKRGSRTRKPGKSTTVFGGGRAAGNKPVPTDQYSLF
ncbi:hypothetical protein P9597_09245 [Aneurinibacillus migulanus]|uniref:hypothetical protein n=1 Tax=Aneurinibacillus migulanus TaxID=47500 RepID=UPI002E211D78|nr:hypothetical protein [Aneurinibacillus migulanus]